MTTPLKGNGSEIKWYTHKLVLGMSSVLIMLLIAITAFAFASIEKNTDDIEYNKECIHKVENEMGKRGEILKYIKVAVDEIKDDIKEIKDEK